MIDPDRANRILLNDYEFMRLRASFNGWGVFRFLVYVGAVILAITAGIANAWGVLIGGLIASFVLVMICEYNRSMIRARQQARALALGVIEESDLR